MLVIKKCDWLKCGIKPLFLILSILLTIIVVRSCIKQQEDFEEIRSNPQFTHGKIIDYNDGRSKTFEYIYVINSKEYKGTAHVYSRLHCEKVDIYRCLGTKYWVIYSKRNPEKSYLLTDQYTYELFHLKVPEKFSVE